MPFGPADRLPADDVEDKMLGALIDTYHQTDIIQEAIMAVAAHAADAQHDRQKTISAIDTDLTEIAAKIDRYLNAFENNTMTEATAGERVARVKERARHLKAHREDLTSAAEDDPKPLGITPSDLDDMREEIVQLLNQGAPGAKNALFRALIHEIQVTGRHRINPYFRIPTSKQTPDQGVRGPYCDTLGSRSTPESEPDSDHRRSHHHALGSSYAKEAWEFVTVTCQGNPSCC